MSKLIDLAKKQRQAALVAKMRDGKGLTPAEQKELKGYEPKPKPKPKPRAKPRRTGRIPWDTVKPKAVELAEQGLSLTDIARLLGVDRNSLYSQAEQDSAFSASLSRARDHGRDVLAANVERVAGSRLIQTLEAFDPDNPFTHALAGAAVNLAKVEQMAQAKFSSVQKTEATVTTISKPDITHLSQDDKLRILEISRQAKEKARSQTQS